MAEDVELGKRIRELRERAGVQSQELALAIGIDPSAMSNIERGKRQVKTDEFAKIAEVLRVSPLALLDGESLLARMPIAARAGDGAVATGSAFSRLLALAELHEVLEQAGIVTHPALDRIPVLNEGNWRESAKRLASWASERLASGAYGDDRFSALAKSIEDEFRVDVIVEEHRGDALLGAAISDRAFPLLFVNADQPTQRALFTLAHELGHLLFGHGEPMALDDSFDGTTDDERAANLFAASFLMPEAEIKDIIRQRGRGAASLAYLTYHFGVSLESLTYRLHDLGEISAAVRDRLRTIGWRGLLDAIHRPELSAHVPETIRRSLGSRQGRRPERRTPAWLVERTREGYRRGIVSVRPLAGLLADDPLNIATDPRSDVAEDLSFESVNVGAFDDANRSSYPPRD